VYVVVKGGLKVFRTDGRGRVQVLQFLKVGDCVGEVPVFDGAPTPSSSEAHGETECWLIPSAPLRQIVHRHPEVAEMIIHHFTAKVRHLVTLVETLSLHSVPERVAQLLLEAHESNPGRFPGGVPGDPGGPGPVHRSEPGGLQPGPAPAD